MSSHPGNVVWAALYCICIRCNSYNRTYLTLDIPKTFFSSHISSYVQPKTILLVYNLDYNSTFWEFCIRLWHKDSKSNKNCWQYQQTHSTRVSIVKLQCVVAKITRKQSILLHVNVLPPIVRILSEQSIVSGAPYHLLWKPQTPVQSLRLWALWDPSKWEFIS